MSKIDDLKSLAKFLLYEDNGKICVGEIGDVDISENLTVKFKAELLKLLTANQ